MRLRPCSAGGVAWETLHALANRDLLTIRERGADDEAEYGLHAMLREFYARKVLSRRARTELHRRAGTYYALPDAPDHDALRAARHLAEGGDQPRAATLLAEGFDALMSQGRTHALHELLSRLEAAQVGAELWPQLVIARAEVFAMLGESAQALASFHETTQLLDALGDTPALRECKARALRGTALAHERLGDYPAAEAACRAGLALYTGKAAPHLEVARLYAQLAEVLLRQGDLNGAEATCHAGLDALPPAPQAARERVTLLQRLATLDGQRGKAADAVRVLDQCLQSARQLGDLALIAAVLHNRGLYLHWSDRQQEALASYLESLRIKQQIGDLAGQAKTVVNLGAVYVELGDADEALRCYEQSADLSRCAQLPYSLGVAELNIGRLLYEQRRLEEAGDHLHTAQRLFTELGDDYNLAECLYVAGDVALALGQPTLAIGAGDQSLLLARRHGAVEIESCALRVLGEVHAMQREHDAAAELLAQAWQLQETVDDDYDRALILTAEAQLSLQRGDGEEAQQKARRALELAEKQRVPFLIERLRALLTRIAGGEQQNALGRAE